MTFGAVILAGGTGARMGGLNKALLKLGDKTFLELITEALSGFEERLLSVHDIGVISDLRLHEVVDNFQGLGPIGGIYSALKVSTKDALLVIPCDVPLFSNKLAEKLVTAMDDNADALICVTNNGRKHPLCGIYTKACLPVLEECLKAGKLRLYDVLESVRCKYFDAGEDSWMLQNINTPAELVALKNGKVPPHIKAGKRNRVELFENDGELFVLKTFMRKEDMENELWALNLLNEGGLPVATAERYGENRLKLEYLYGVTALELFEGLESEGLGFGKRDRGYCRLLCSFIKSVYLCFKENIDREICLNDMNLRNFIFQPEYDRFTGVDFECCKEGSYESDAGSLLAYIMAYEPSNTPYKLAMADFMLGLLADELKIDRVAIENEMKKEQQKMTERRGRKSQMPAGEN